VHDFWVSYKFNAPARMEGRRHPRRHGCKGAFDTFFSAPSLTCPRSLGPRHASDTPCRFRPAASCRQAPSASLDSPTGKEHPKTDLTPQL
jgi:hypothetical protein